MLVQTIIMQMHMHSLKEIKMAFISVKTSLAEPLNSLSVGISTVAQGYNSAVYRTCEYSMYVGTYTPS